MQSYTVVPLIFVVSFLSRISCRQSPITPCDTVHFSSLISRLCEPSICCHGICWKTEDKRERVEACHLPFHKLFLFYFIGLIFIFCDFRYSSSVYIDIFPIFLKDMVKYITKICRSAGKYCIFNKLWGWVGLNPSITLLYSWLLNVSSVYSWTIKPYWWETSRGR